MPLAPPLPPAHHCHPPLCRRLPPPWVLQAPLQCSGVGFRLAETECPWVFSLLFSARLFHFAAPCFHWNKVPCPSRAHPPPVFNSKERLRHEREMEVARLRSLQEKAQDKQAEQDALRAKRAQELYEREWRAKEKAEQERVARIEKGLAEARLVQQRCRLDCVLCARQKFGLEGFGFWFCNSPGPSWSRCLGVGLALVGVHRDMPPKKRDASGSGLGPRLMYSVPCWWSSGGSVFTVSCSKPNGAPFRWVEQ